MAEFAFVVHPVDARSDMARQYPWARLLPTAVLEAVMKAHRKPIFLCDMTGIRSPDGKETRGYLVGVPMTARQMLREPPEATYEILIECARFARSLGAGIIGLGGFCSVVGDAGKTVAEHSPIPTTTGHSYTVWAAVEGLRLAAAQAGIRTDDGAIGVVGATGAIGRACALALAGQARELLLVGKDKARLEVVADEVRSMGECRVRIADATADLRETRLVVSATNDPRPVIAPTDLCRGAIVCDVAMPPDLGPGFSLRRPDVTVVPGGVISVPGAPAWKFNFRLPPGQVFACMAETIILALEGRLESFTLGKRIGLESVREMGEMAQRNGFAVVTPTPKAESSRASIPPTV